MCPSCMAWEVIEFAVISLISHFLTVYQSTLCLFWTGKKILITSKCPWNYAKNSMILNNRHFLIACHLKNKKTFYFVKNFVFKGTENSFWIPQDRNLLLLFLIFFLNWRRRLCRDLWACKLIHRRQITICLC